MSTLDQDLIQTLEKEYKTLVSVLEGCNKKIATFTSQIQEIEQKILLLDPNEPNLEETISGLRKEQNAFQEELNTYQRKAKLIDEKIKLSAMKCDFQKEIVALWDKEEFYRIWLDETGFTGSDY